MNNTTSDAGIKEVPFDDFEREHGGLAPESSNGKGSVPQDHYPISDWPSQPDKAAFHGLAGEYVRLIEPHTESDPIAILIQFLVGCGSIIGRGPYFQVENDRHFTNLNVVLVGATAKGRKGTSLSQALRLFNLIDPDWRTLSGLGSGEGLIWSVHDAIEKQEARREKGKETSYQTVIADHGISDKRLLVIEAEFASTLKVAGRQESTLSPVIRKAWDTGDLHILTKNSPATATGAHISIIGHITKGELLRLLDSTEMANGFANRFLWVCARRSRILPEGGNLLDEQLYDIERRLRDAIKFARSVGRVERDTDARRIWAEEYELLSRGRPGMLGACTSRAEAQVTRLSLILALLDRSGQIWPEHLRAALALWRYCDDSARFIFGDTLGDRDGDTILTALREAGPAGLTRDEIVTLTARHVSGNRLNRAIQTLLEAELVRIHKESTGGRPRHRIIAI